MKGKVNNVIRIPASLDGSFFVYWLEFLSPIHNLTHREIEIAAAILKTRYELEKVIKDDVILDKVVMGEEYKKKIMEECNISLSYLQGITSTLKKRGMLVDGRINQKFIPKITNEDSFSLLIHFDLG